MQALFAIFSMVFPPSLSQTNSRKKRFKNITLLL